MGDLDEDEYDALLEAVGNRRETESWTNLHEAVASAVEAMWAVLARLEAGVPVVHVEKTGKAAQPARYPRPEFVDTGDAPAEPGVVVVTSVRDALLLMRTKGGEPSA